MEVNEWWENKDLNVKMCGCGKSMLRGEIVLGKGRGRHRNGKNHERCDRKGGVGELVLSWQRAVDDAIIWTQRPLLNVRSE